MSGASAKATERMAADRAADAERKAAGDAERAFELLTPIPLIERIRGERNALILQRDHAAGYGGPDPNPEATARNNARIEVLSDVLDWIIDFERGEALAAVNEATRWIARK